MSTKGHMATRVLLGAIAVMTVFAGPQNARAEKFYDLFNFPDLDWYVIHTEHFNVFYPVSRKGPDETRFYLDGNDAARKAQREADAQNAIVLAALDFYHKLDPPVIGPEAHFARDAVRSDRPGNTQR